MHETAIPVAPCCEIRSADTHRLEARADADGFIIASRHGRQLYRLSWDAVEQIKQGVQRGEPFTVLLKQATS